MLNPNTPQDTCKKEAEKERAISVGESLRLGSRRGGGKSDNVLKQVPVEEGMKILDVGMGTGEASEFFISKGAEVHATGLDTEIYGIDEKWISENKVNIVNARVENLCDYFGENTFDAVWIAHVLEHTMNPGFAVQQIWKVLKDDGWLFICVPPYKSKIVGGHLNTGWNVGQLIYFLLLSGFNVKDGHFAKIDYNVVGFCRKSRQELPRLYYDVGDLERLGPYWPIEFNQGIEGNDIVVNWPVKK